MTWKIPKNLTLQSDIKYELNIVATEFEEKDSALAVFIFTCCPT